MSINQIARLRHVKRWGIVNTTTTQTVADHTCGVALIADWLLYEIGLFDNKWVRLCTLDWALYHDTSEIFTGDTPSPMKKKMQDAGHEVEDEIEEYTWAIDRVVDSEHGLIAIAVVKLADTIEAVMYLDTDGAGGHARRVREKLFDSLPELCANVSRESPMLRVDPVLLSDKVISLVSGTEVDYGSCFMTGTALGILIVLAFLMGGCGSGHDEPEPTQAQRYCASPAFPNVLYPCTVPPPNWGR